MSKRIRSFTQKKYEKWLKEGRGTGKLSSYKPWLTTKDVASKGRSHRIHGITTDRQQELLSDQERNYFYYLEYADEVKDIREQYPLLPLEQTIAIADELAIKHSTDPTTKYPTVLTTDFLITVERDGKFIDIARTIKQKDDLMSKRQMEKFQIEKRYWELKGVDWGIVTDEEISKVFAMNISSIHSYFDLTYIDSFENISFNQQKKLIAQFKDTVIGTSVVIRECAEQFDEKVCLPFGTGLSIFKHLLITKQIYVDLFNKLDFESTQEILELA